MTPPAIRSAGLPLVMVIDSGHILKEIEYFFSIYKDLEGKKVVTSGWRDTGYAWEVVNRGRKAFAEPLHSS